MARRLVLATGGTDRPRRLDVPGEDLPHVSSYFQDPHAYFGRRVLIVGGKNSAVEAALRCHNAGANVCLSYRRERLDPNSIKYWLLPEMNGLIASGKIEAHFNTTPAFIGPAHVELVPAGAAGATAGSVPTRIEADFVLLLIGYEADLRLLRSAAWSCWGRVKRRFTTRAPWRPMCRGCTSPAPLSAGRRTNTASSSRTATSMSRASLRPLPAPPHRRARAIRAAGELSSKCNHGNLEQNDATRGID